MWIEFCWISVYFYTCSVLVPFWFLWFLPLYGQIHHWAWYLIAKFLPSASHICIYLIDTHEIVLGLTVFCFVCACSVSIFCLFCVFLFWCARGAKYHICVDHLGWGASERAQCEPLFIQLEISQCLKNHVGHIGRSREKKAGVVNALVRVSTVLTDVPYMLNLDCDHYINDGKALRERVFHVGLKKDSWSSSFDSRDWLWITCYKTCSSCWHTRYLVHLCPCKTLTQ